MLKYLIPLLFISSIAYADEVAVSKVTCDYKQCNYTILTDEDMLCSIEVIGYFGEQRGRYTHEIWTTTGRVYPVKFKNRSGLKHKITRVDCDSGVSS